MIIALKTLLLDCMGANEKQACLFFFSSGNNGLCTAQDILFHLPKQKLSLLSQEIFHNLSLLTLHYSSMCLRQPAMEAHEKHLNMGEGRINSRD
ncbi:hypothetical protein P8452_24030 [Trifolium repens]|nr:hypothetical protein P8452_24030 [Trifolium repens]